MPALGVSQSKLDMRVLGHILRSPAITLGVGEHHLKVDEPPEGEEDSEGEEEGEAKKPVAGPVTIWIGVFPESTSATAAHDAAKVVRAHLKDYQITDVDIDFRVSIYTREVGTQLHKPVGDPNPLVDVISPLTPAPGLCTPTRAKPDAQGTKALYLAEGGDRDRLLAFRASRPLRIRGSQPQLRSPPQ
jgi:hypothetical protein